jgi:hypothetical protein
MKNTIKLSLIIPAIVFIASLQSCEDWFDKNRKYKVYLSEVSEITSSSFYFATYTEENCTEMGICYSLTADPIYQLDGTKKAYARKGYYDESVWGLEPNTTYYVRAYAIINNMVEYSLPQIIQTKVLPEPVCTLKENKYKFSDDLEEEFRKFYEYTNDNGYYEISADGGKYDFNLIFFNKPTTGVYYIHQTDILEMLRFNEVEFVEGGDHATDGDSLIIISDSNQLSISFCNLELCLFQDKYHYLKGNITIER